MRRNKGGGFYPMASKQSEQIGLAMTWRTVFAILTGAAVLTLPAWFNGFPFVFPDSGDYLVFHPLLHRSPYYGLFIFFFHLNRFIWGPIITQAIIVAHLLWMLTRLTGGAERAESRFLLLAVLLTLLSSLPFFVGFIMADICTPIMFLAMYMIAFHYEALSRPMLAYLLLLDCVATSGHITNLPLAVGLLALFIILVAVQSRRGMRLHALPLKLLAAPIALTVAAVLLFNGLIFGTWSLSPASQSFSLANLIAYGPGRHYLHDVCPRARYKICAYTDNLPASADALLWSSGIFERLGGFPGMQDEARQIVRGTLETYPAEVATMIVHNFAAGLVTHAPAAEFRAANLAGVPSFPQLIERKFGPAALHAFENSAQMHDALPYALLNHIDRLVFPLSSLGLAFVAATAYRRRDAATLALALATAGFVLGDMLLCTALSGVHDRYQARVTWLVPLTVLLYVLSARHKIAASRLAA
jgi:hypothetical protein